ncbi:uncharacterized protein LOC131436709 [Malaya genurostris]|uniref:uncharacterized protein LOC131436709 n=1 Tax=Malaya genurostris TaxID=325434 RepID=UPI0026F39680|nr:uncharacterized protein LOC131436709 [Malaya genurostris]XP_058461560.1 uncharacterized protein LOC131436709 [Malaya genurostris]XP_058461561.1 uncharacterized protein LOC131436709 [Malaya genurostris]
MSSRKLRSKRSNKKVAGKGANGDVQTIVTEDANETIFGQACRACRELDTDEMVMCDSFSKWYHFHCVGVTQEIENFPWRCSKCTDANGVQETSSTVNVSHHSDKNARERTTQKPSSKILPKHKHQLDSSDKNQPVDVSLPSHSFKTAGQQKADLTSVDAVRMWTELRKSIVSGAPSVASSRSSQALARLQIQRLEDMREVERREAERQRVIAAEEARREKDFLERKYQLLEQAMSESSSIKAASEPGEDNWLPEEYQQVTPDNVSNYSVSHESGPPDPFPAPSSSMSCLNRNITLNVTSSKNHPRDTTRRQLNLSVCHLRKISIAQKHNPPANPTNLTSPLIMNSAPREFHPNNSRLSQDGQDSRCISNREYRGGLDYSSDRQRNVPHPSSMRNCHSDGYEQDESLSISRKQLAARQAIAKDLPTFSGNPEEWPLFVSTFNSTTAMCGFTNEENIVRLQRCLKGRAYEAVRCRLMHPSNVNGVMSTLKMLFGQPEVIVNSMMSKINSMPALKEDKLETLVDFAVNVENFCATVDACGLEEYFYNVTFLHQLVNKLPASIKLNWAQYRRSLPIINLPSFSNWLYSLAEAASAVTFSSIIPEIKNTRNDSRAIRKSNSYLNAHSEQLSPDHQPAVLSNAKPPTNCCLVCKGNCKSIAKCRRFLEFCRDSRWSTVRDLGLCRRCLRQHKGGCQTRMCGKNGCKLKHQAVSSNSCDQISPTKRDDLPKSNSITSEHGCHTHQVSSNNALFRYLPVVLHGKQRSVQTFAFLDDGSELTLLDSDLADDLQLEGNIEPLCLRWTGGATRREDCSRSVRLEVASKHEPFRRYSLHGVRTVKELLLPPQTMNIEELTTRYPHLSGLPIASYRDIRPRILIGIKHQHLSLVRKSREGAPHQPVAVKTRLGWTVCGGGNSDEASSLVHSVFHVCSCKSSTDEDLHKAMKEYFTIDGLGVTQPKRILLSAEDERARSLLQTCTVFKGDRYETGLLRRYENVRLPDSYPMALRRLQCLKKRMDKDPELAETLNQKITDLVTKGYARKLTEQELNQAFPRVWYLPIFPVTNIHKPGKIRMVWTRLQQPTE